MIRLTSPFTRGVREYSQCPLWDALLVIFLSGFIFVLFKFLQGPHHEIPILILLLPFDFLSLRLYLKLLIKLPLPLHFLLLYFLFLSLFSFPRFLDLPLQLFLIRKLLLLLDLFGRGVFIAEETLQISSMRFLLI